MKFVSILAIVCLSKFNILANTLFLSYSVDGDKIYYSANLDKQLIETETELESILALSHKAYDIVENKTHRKRKIFKNAIGTLSKELLHPFKTLVGESSQIIITIDKELIKIPFEYFRIGDHELNIYKPLLFRLEATHSDGLDKVLKINSGTIIRVKDCDPQNACKTIKKSNPLLKFYSSKHIDPSQLSKEKQDLLLISAHGYAYEKNRGFMGWNKAPVKAEQLNKLNPKFTYFDSCQQGINLNYLEALIEAEGLNYYLAPVISNDSGDSSTKTIEWFFEYINAEVIPIDALIETKRRLFTHYKRKRFLTRYNKSLSFRMYIL